MQSNAARAVQPTGKEWRRRRNGAATLRMEQRAAASLVPGGGEGSIRESSRCAWHAAVTCQRTGKSNFERLSSRLRKPVQKISLRHARAHYGGAEIRRGAILPSSIQSGDGEPWIWSPAHLARQLADGPGRSRHAETEANNRAQVNPCPGKTASPELHASSKGGSVVMLRQALYQRGMRVEEQPQRSSVADCPRRTLTWRAFPGQAAAWAASDHACGAPLAPPQKANRVCRAKGVVDWWRGCPGSASSGPALFPGPGVRSVLARGCGLWMLSILVVDTPPSVPVISSHVPGIPD
ncbi:hypothetical protein ACCO45_005551 [Purpureocillium lilacinum]|uniref:Uncharacterized protein n=1 Tax=Purpureocillium lilacinum TaxID=33203 RepID=A0ACC4DY26_PURLI